MRPNPLEVIFYIVIFICKNQKCKSRCMAAKIIVICRIIIAQMKTPWSMESINIKYTEYLLRSTLMLPVTNDREVYLVDDIKFGDVLLDVEMFYIMS